jgi:ABC-type glycerol-3-phosphate transport system substrate-binding protein
MRRVLAVSAVLVITSVLAACSGSGTAQLPTTLPPTKCVEGAGDASRTVRVEVVAPSQGSGELSANVRIVVAADASNADVAEVRLTSGDAEVVVVRGVAAGDSCAVDLELAAGRYTAAAAGRSVDFDVQP